MPRRGLQFDLTTNTRDFNRGLGQAERRMRGFEGTVTRSSRNMLGGLGRLAGAAGFAGVAGGIVAIGRAGVSYEKDMSRVRAVTGANGKEMRQLGGLAKRMGADTKFSAGEAAQGMYELGAAGFKVNEMGGALRGTLALAAASNTDLATASEITANALRGFRLDSDKATHVADVLARTVNASSVEVGDLQNSLKYIAPVAQTTGQSLEEMVAAVGLMGDAGIKGEQAGTTLRGALVRLTRPTKSVEAGFADLHIKATDLQGPKGLKPLSEIIEIVEHHTRGMDKATRNAALANVFGTEALSGMVALVDRGSGALEKNTRANERSRGTAEKAAKTMQDNVAGAWEQLTGSIETAGISIYEKFQKPLQSGLLDATHLVNDAARDFEDFFTTVSRDPDFKSGDLADKIAVIGDELERRHVPEKIRKVVVDGVEMAGDAALDVFKAAAPEVAKAFVEGFVDAPIWLRALGVGFLLRKLGGLRGLQTAGTQASAAFATGFARGGVPPMGGGAGPVLAPGRPGAGAPRGGGGGGLPPFMVFGGGGETGTGGQRSSIDRTRNIAAQQRGWPGWRSGAPVSQLGTRTRTTAIGRAGGFVRGAGAGLASAFGGPPGMLVAGGLIVGPELVKQANARTQRFNLPKTGGFFGEAGRYLNPKDPLGNEMARSRSARGFGDTAETRLGQLTKASDVRGLKALAAEARQIAEDYPKARKELGRFAKAAEDAAARAQVAGRGLRGVRIKAGDIIDTQAASTLENDMRRLARDGVGSIRDLREGVESNQALIERAFQSGSKGSADAMASNFRSGIIAVKRSMADGRISTKDGMAEIRKLVRQQMRAAAGNMDQFSDSGRAALAKNFRSAADAVRTQMRRGVIGTKEGMGEIRKLMRAELQAYGLSETQATNVQKTGDLDANRGREGGATRKAGGGYMVGPGYKGHDKYDAVLGAGEFVASDPMQPEIEQGLSLAKVLGLGRFGSLGELERASIAGQLPKHYLATGGRVTGDTDYGSAMRRALNRMAKGTGRDIFVQSGGRSPGEQMALKARYGNSRPVAGPNGPHVRGVAADITPGREAFGSVAARYGLGFPIGVEPWHAQLLAGGAGSAAPADVQASLRRVRVSGVPGTLGRVAQGAVDRVHGAAQNRLRALVGDANGGDGAAPGGRTSAGGTYNKARLMALWRRANPGLGDANLMAAIALAESSGDPNASNGPYHGLWQVGPGGPFDPLENARAAGQKLRTQGLGAWEVYTKGTHRKFLAKGGFVGKVMKHLDDWYGRHDRPNPQRSPHSPTPRHQAVRHGKLRNVMRHPVRRVGGRQRWDPHQVSYNARGGFPARLRRLGLRPGMAIGPERAVQWGISRELAKRVGLRWVDPVTWALGEAPSTSSLSRGDEFIEDADQDIALQGRADDLDEEDLATPQGRAQRAGELGIRAWGQQGIVEAVGGQQRTVARAQGATRRALRAARSQRRQIDRRYQARVQRAKPKSRARARLVRQRRQALTASRQRIGRLERRRASLGKSAVGLRRTRKEREMDVRESIEQREEITGPSAVLQGDLEMIDLRERAGEITTEQADEQRETARQAALGSGKLTDRQRLEIEADRRAGRDPVSKVNDKLSEIDLRLRAGEFGSDAGAAGRADEAKRQALQDALSQGGLNERESLELRAQLAETTKAIEDARQAQEEHTQALKDVADQMKRNNDIAEGVIATSGREAVAALADIISGDLGARTARRDRTPGDGSSWRF